MRTATPSRADLLRQAFVLLGRGQINEAERACRHLLVREPADSAAATLLGHALLAKACPTEAVSVFTTLTRREPTQRTHWQNLGTALRAAGRLDDALAAYTRAAQDDANSADFLYNVGLLHLDRADLESATAVLETAVRLAPDDAAIRCAWADCLHRRMRTDDALEALAGWEDWRNLDSECAARLAQLLLSLGAAEAAERALARARGDPHLNAHTALTIVQVLERTNRVTAAREQLARVPLATAGQRTVERLELEALLAQREGRHADACDFYRKALERIDALHARHHQLFPLARSLDALGEYEAAFATLREAHASQVAELARSAPDMIARGAHTMGITQFGCDADDIARWYDPHAPAAAASPIFVVGFPRSGTTLLEQAVDAHPALESMDEQPYLQYALDVLLERGAAYPHRLADVPDQDLAAAREHYFSRVRRRVALAPGQRLVDKNPLNLLRLPVIRRLFPNARILMVVRHPCDVLISCYMQHFRAPDFALLCADLDRLATGYRRAMDFWVAQYELLAPAVREVCYERFVADFDREIRSICEFLELEFDDAMLAPAERARRRRFVSTPSYAQVVEPVNTRAVGRSRPYLHHFGQAVQLLEPCLARWGYTH